MSKGTKIVLIIIGAFVAMLIIGTTIFVAVDLNVEPRFEIKDGVLKISDTYAKSISLEGAQIELLDSVHQLGRRIAGTNSGNLKKGRFTLAGGEEIYLSLVRADMKCILIDNGKKHYINCAEEYKTLALYDELKRNGYKG